MGADIAEYAPGDAAALDEAHAAGTAAFAVDAPGVPLLARGPFEVVCTESSDAVLKRLLLARADGRVVGFAKTEMWTQENRHLAEVWGLVDPAYRRRGIGRALLAAVRELCAGMGRDTLHFEARVPVPGGPGVPDGQAFCEVTGMERALEENYLRLDLSALSDVDEAGLERLRASAWERAEGYSLLQWCDGVAGDPPAEVVPGLVALLNRFFGDTPTGSMEVEELAYTPERFMADNATGVRQGRFTVNTAVRHDATGEIAAWTKIHNRRTAPHYGLQGITMAAAAHRGHRLGTVVKTENLAYLRRELPDVTVIDTDNAASNTHMLRVNEAMGFKPFQDSVIYQLKL